MLIHLARCSQRRCLLRIKGMFHSQTRTRVILIHRLVRRERTDVQRRSRTRTEGDPGERYRAGRKSYPTSVMVLIAELWWEANRHTDATRLACRETRKPLCSDKPRSSGER